MLQQLLIIFHKIKLIQFQYTLFHKMNGIQIDQ